MARAKKDALTNGAPELARLPLGRRVVVEDDDGNEIPMLDKGERDIEQLLEEVGGDATVKIARISEANTRQHVGGMAAADFSLDSLADAYGGGRYHLRAFIGKREVGSSIVEIDPMIPQRNPRNPNRTSVHGSANPPVTSASDMAGVIASMAQMGAQSAAMLQNIVANQAAQMGTLMTAVTGMMAASAGNKSDPLETAIRLREVVGGGGGAKEYMEAFTAGLSLAEKYSGKGGSDDSVMPLLGHGLQTLEKLADGWVADANARKLHAERLRPVPAATAPTPTPPVAEINAPEREVITVPDRTWIAEARPVAGVLLGMVGRVSPETAADAALDMLSEGAQNDLVDDIEAGTVDGKTFVDRLCEAFKVSADENATKWLEALANTVRVRYAEDTAEEPEK